MAISDIFLLRLYGNEFYVVPHFNTNFLPIYRTVLYECCPGYMRMEGMKGCPAGKISITEMNEELVLCEEKDLR